MPLTVRKRKDSPYYHVTGSIPGYGRVRESTGTARLAEAREYAAALETRIRAALIHTTSDLTVSHAILEYVEHTGRTAHLEKINFALGRVKLSEINQQIIDRAARETFQNYKKGTRGKIRPYRPASLRRMFYAPLATVLHYAHDLGWMPYIRVKMPKAERPAPRWADKNWFKLFFAHATPDLRALTVFLAGTGCRISEALNLLSRDVDLERATAYVRTTKTGTPREVYLPPFVAEALAGILSAEKEQEDQGGRNGREARVFAMWRTRHQVNDALERTARAAGVEYLSSHKVGSHTFATNLARFGGMDSRALTETGRWKDPKSAAHYTHFVRREAAQKADTLGELFEG